MTEANGEPGFAASSERAHDPRSYPDRVPLSSIWKPNLRRIQLDEPYALAAGGPRIAKKGKILAVSPAASFYRYSAQPCYLSRVAECEE
ncbi:MAG TPA: hypothetical protein VE687_08660 [Stellaceae bacterium]|nr:hypothetical protein [Stellaceae bacterium]